MSFTCVMSKSMHYKRSERKSRTSNLPNYKSSNTCKQHLAKGQRSRYGTFIKDRSEKCVIRFRSVILNQNGKQKRISGSKGLQGSFGPKGKFRSFVSHAPHTP